MISFHPLPKTTTLLKSFLGFSRCNIKPLLSQRFPNHTTHLVDSGTSALALIIEELELEGKKLALPAFLCDDLAPVLKHYHITPIFLDIDPETFQPPLAAYKEVIDTIDAALLVATYGREVNKEIISLLSSEGKGVIEDRAHLPLPQEPEDIETDACLYSLPKTTGTPDGGLAVVPQSEKRTFPKASFALSYLRNVIKLLKPLNTTVGYIKSASSISIENQWSGITRPHKLTHSLLFDYLKNERSEWTPRYCYPFRVKNPTKAKRTLTKHGITAEAIWNNPIPTAFEKTLDTYPHTKKASQTVICVPGWHIRSSQKEKEYIEKLKSILSNHLT